MALPVFQTITSQPEQNTSSITLTKPTGTVANDYLFATFYTANDASTITPPSGWSLLKVSKDSANVFDKLYLWSYGKLAGGSEPSSYTFTFSAGSYNGGNLMRISGVDLTTPVNVARSKAMTTGSAADDTAAGSSTVSLSSITTTSADCLCVAALTTWNTNSSGFTFSGWTPRGAFDYGRSYTRAVSAAGLVSEVNASGTESATWATLVVALNPIPSGSSGPVLKRWNGSAWVSAVVKHGSGWPTVNLNGL